MAIVSWVASGLEKFQRSGRNAAESSKDIGNADKGEKVGKSHFVVVSQFYKPEPFIFPPAIAAALFEDGNRVSVVTGYPNRPGGRLYEGYKQKFGFSEMIEGVEVFRAPLIINHSRKAVERILNFLSFSVTALSVTAKVKNADAVYVYATPATAAIPAQIWSKLFGIPYVLHVQDLWPESVTDSGMLGNRRLAKIAETLMSPWLKRLYGNAEQLIAISPGMRQLLINRGNDPNKCSVVYNWADETTISEKKSGSFLGTELQLLYAGNLGPMQDLENVIEAARKFESRDGFSLKIAGSGILEESLHTAAIGLMKVEFLGRLPRTEVSKLYLESDFQLVTLKDIPIFRTTVPSKLQASLASGVPVITSVKGDVADLISEYNAGLVAEPEDVDSLAAVFEEAIRMSAEERMQMGRNARRLYEEKMSVSSGTSTISSIINHAALRGRSDRAHGRRVGRSSPR